MYVKQLPTIIETGLSGDEDSSQDGFEFLANDTNNSMPVADKPYDPPVMPDSINAYLNGFEDQASRYRETFRPVRRNYVIIYFRVRRRNYEPILWQLLSNNVFTKDKMYLPQYMPYWTIGIRMRLRNSFPMGTVMDVIKKRLGLTHPGLRFCLDGFFGMLNYADVFGNTADSCPWMEISNFSTAKSLQLQDGDSIFMSIASMGQIENVRKWKAERAVEVPSNKAPEPDTQAPVSASSEEAALSEDGAGQTIGG